jgi:BASS family bile acid:Na+ symporter
MQEGIQVLDDLKLNFSPEGLFILNFTLFFIMFGVALDIKISHIKEVFANPKPAIIGYCCQFFLLPAITFLLIWTLKDYLSPGVALGMILMAACPGGNISNFFSSLAKGNPALSISLTAMATLSASLLTPLNFSFWGNLYAANNPLLVPIEIDTLELIKMVMIILGIPTILGMWFNHRFPYLTQKIKKPIKSLSMIIFFTYVIIAFSFNFDYFTQYIKYVFWLVLAHNTLAILTGFGVATLFGVSKKNRRSISIETGIQNSGLALILIFNPAVFPEELGTGGMAMIAGWWSIWHILSGFTISLFWARKPLV